MIQTCKTCRYRGYEIEHKDLGFKEVYYKCNLVHQKDTSATIGEQNCFIDSYSYYGFLCVNDDFGCNQWEKRDER